MASAGAKARRRAKQSKIVQNLTIAKETALSLLNDDDDDCGVSTQQLEDEVSDVVARANKIQREKKRNHVVRPSTSSSGSKRSTSVSVCKMKKSPRGLYSRDGIYYACSADKEDQYDSFISKACKVLGIKAKKGKKLRLFKPGRGAVIPPCTDDDTCWTLGGYIRATHTSAEKVVLGVGYTTDSSSEESSEESSSSDGSTPPPLPKRSVDKGNKGIEVFYRSVISSRSWTVFNRQEVWSDVGKDDSLQMPITFQPEDAGYCVASISIDGDLIYSDSDSSTCDDIVIKYQSPEIMKVRDFNAAVMLYCVGCSKRCTYRWESLPPSRIVPTFSTPVIYVSRPVLCQCTITGDNGKQCKSKMISVSLDLSTSVSASQNSQEYGHRELSSSREEHASLTSKQLPPTTVMRFTVSEVQLATDDFNIRHLVGEGGFGRVYHAMLRHTHAAIKILNREGEQALKSEVNILSKFRHPNLVPLMGFCKELSVLVYEYMDGGSLYHRLHEDSDKGKLSWDERAMVLKDVCLGMVYLHSAKPPLIHQDIKTLNILLDSNGRGRIGDFGFSWELPDVEGSRSVFTSRGFAFSKGYTAPELTYGKCSTKSDVYSYGIVTLETFSGLKAYSTERVDYLLSDHLQDSFISIENFKLQNDKSIGECPESLLGLIFQIVPPSLKTLSQRPSSTEVLSMWESSSCWK